LQDISVLKEALPYLRRFKGARFVIKFGGEAIRSQEALDLLVEDISFLYNVGIQVVLVHGGGVQVSDIEKKLGVESRKVGGRRVTSSESLEVLKMVLAGKLNIDIVAALQSAGVKAMGLAGVSAGIISARRRPPVKVSGSGGEVVDFGEVGDIEAVNTDPIVMLLENGYLPVISPLSADTDGAIYNINADSVAAALASGLKADKLMLMTSTLGVMTDLSDATTLVSQLTTKQARQAIKQEIISGGMIPKVEESLKALDAGVRQVHILSGMEEHQLLLEVFTESGCGTMLMP
jgi:acetylglutamate kinase